MATYSPVKQLNAAHQIMTVVVSHKVAVFRQLFQLHRGGCPKSSPR